MSKYVDVRLFHDMLNSDISFLKLLFVINSCVALTYVQNKSNLVTPRNGELLIAATQDFITGAYMLTQKDNFLNRGEACQLAATLLAGDDTNMQIDLPPPAIRKVSTSLGILVLLTTL